MKRYKIFLFFIVIILLGCDRFYSHISIDNTSDKQIYTIIAYEDGSFSGRRFSPHMGYGFSTENSVHGPAAIYIYVYEHDIPINLFGDTDALKKYVKENKAISEYSLKELCTQEEEYGKNNKPRVKYVIKDYKIQRIPIKN